MLRQLNCACTRSREARPMAARRSGSAINSFDCGGQVALKRFGVARFGGAVALRLEMHELPGLARYQDLGDSADRRGDDRRFARHRFQVDDAEGLVDGRTDEEVAVLSHRALRSLEAGRDASPAPRYAIDFRAAEIYATQDAAGDGVDRRYGLAPPASFPAQRSK
jgi:hypothetical protein